MTLEHGFDRISSCPNCRVKASDLFDSGLPGSAAEELRSMAVVKTCPAGEILFEEERAPGGVFVVDSGRVKLGRHVQERLQVIKIARAGDVLGLGATLTNHLHHVTGEVVSDAMVRFFSIVEFHRFLKRHGMYLGRLVLYLEQHAHRERPPFPVSAAAARVATYLLDTAVRDGRETPEGVRVELPLTERELSSVLLMPPDRLNDVLDRFEDHHWLYRGQRSVTLLEESALTAISRGSES